MLSHTEAWCQTEMIHLWATILSWLGNTVPFQSIRPVTHHRAQFWLKFAPWSPVTGAAVRWALQAPTPFGHGMLPHAPSWSRHWTMSWSLGPAVEPAHQNTRVTGHTPGRIDWNGTVAGVNPWVWKTYPLPYFLKTLTLGFIYPYPWPLRVFSQKSF